MYKFFFLPVMLVLIKTQAQTITGFSPNNAAAQLQAEQQFDAQLNAAHIGSTIKLLSSKPHNLGSAGSKEVADTILNRYKQYLFATLTIQKDADKLAASLNKNGQWNDINYQDNEKAGWKPLIHLNRLRDLAFAYAKPQSKFYHQLEILQAAKSALNHWLQTRYKCPNWWHNEIGVPQQIRDVIILLQKDLSTNELQGALEIMAQYQIHDNSTGANLTWSADLGTHYALLTNNKALAQKCRDLIIEEIKITTGDGVQPDYSFHQHDKRLQMYQYGGAFLRENVRLAWELRGTSLSFPKEKINLLTDFVLQGWQWTTRGINTVPGTMDRSASRRDALHSSDIRQLIPYLIDVIPGRKNDLLSIADHQNGRGSLVGFRYFPYSDFAAYQQPGFSFFVKTISTRTLATESINSENLKGHLLNSGDAYFIRDGNEAICHSYRHWPGQDRGHRPGHQFPF